jgi:hypothetical protein
MHGPLGEMFGLDRRMGHDALEGMRFALDSLDARYNRSATKKSSESEVMPLVVEKIAPNADD